MKIDIELQNVVIRNIGDKNILVDIKNNKVFIINEITYYLIEEILCSNYIDIFKYSKLYNLEIDEAKTDINNLIKFLDSNNLVKGDKVLL